MAVALEALWSQVADRLQREIKAPTFSSWIKEVEPLSFVDGVLELTAPNDFTRNWVETRYGAVIRASLSDLAGVPVDLRLTAPPDGGQSSTRPASDTITTPATTAPAAPLTGRNAEYARRLNPKYTFSSFVIGNSNQFAQATCVAVADMPGRAYNPLFIYGGVGLGKTHLMHAIGHRVLDGPGHPRVLYVSTETFTNEMVTALQDNRMVQFRERYRDIDVLLIDDIQFVAGKERTQEEFFHTFEALHGSRKQIVISSDRPPKDIPSLEDRLRSRFEWGMISDIQLPDMETRIAILAKKAQTDGLVATDEVLQFIASRVDTNIRELEGALIRVIAYASVMQAPLTLDLAYEALKNVVALNHPRPVTIRAIQEEVARHYDLKLEDFKSRRRTRAIAFPRQVAMYLARQLTDASLPKIGEEFGGRDHTTVMHAFDKITADKTKDPHLVQVLEEIERRVKSR